MAGRVGADRAIRIFSAFPGGSRRIRPMRRRSIFALTFIFFVMGQPRVLSDESNFRADVVIYGGTSAGVAAAVQVARMGKSVVVIEPTDHLGGLTTNGLGATDSGRKETIGGISREFYRRIHEHYRDPAAWPLQDPSEPEGKGGAPIFNPKADAMWVFEPKVAQSIMDGIAAESGAKLFFNERLDRANGVAMKDGRLTAITMESGKRFEGAMFVDATYEGDLLAAAGVSFHVGREANSVYGETLNGVQKTQMKGHLFTKPVDPYVVPGDPSSGLVARVSAEPPGEDGAGDSRIQAFNFRMCMSKDERNRVPFPKPEGYDETQYELLFRNFEAGDLRLPWSPGMMPNHKTDTNNYGAFSTDNIGMNYAYADASHEERARIVKEHVVYQQGLMWTLANHPRVPEVIREAMKPWGLAADEFVGNGNWPRQIYVREARRMISDYVVTEQDCRRVRVAEDSVGLGSYNMDSHNVQRYVTADGKVQNEGDVQVSPGGPYVVSYRSIVPKKGQAAMAVFFGKADFGIESRAALTTAIELNPQMGRELVVIETSPTLLPGIVCLSTLMPQELGRRYVAEATRLHQQIRYKQAFIVMRVTRIVEFQPAMLESSRALVARQKALASKR